MRDRKTKKDSSGSSSSGAKKQKLNSVVEVDTPTGSSNPSNAPIEAPTGSSNPSNAPIEAPTGSSNPSNAPIEALTGSSNPSNAPIEAPTGSSNPKTSKQASTISEMKLPGFKPYPHQYALGEDAVKSLTHQPGIYISDSVSFIFFNPIYFDRV
jgi:hypothetical protein